MAHARRLILPCEAGYRIFNHLPLVGRSACETRMRVKQVGWGRAMRSKMKGATALCRCRFVVHVDQHATLEQAPRRAHEKGNRTNTARLLLHSHLQASGW